jgi:hypothetical protein
MRLFSCAELAYQATKQALRDYWRSRRVSRMKSDELATLYPNLSPDELERARENLRQYLLLAWEIWETHEKRSAHFDGSEPPLYDQGKVDSPNKNNSPNL